MPPRLEIIFRLFDEAMIHVRHLEEQRSRFASVLVAIAGGVVVLGFADGANRSEFYPGYLLAGIGAFGLVLSWKQNEKINFHRRVSIRYRELISSDPLVASDLLEKIRADEDKINNRRFFYISIAPVGLFWSLLYVLILCFGMFIICHEKTG